MIMEILNISKWAPTVAIMAESYLKPTASNIFWQLLRDGNLHGSGMSHTTTASPKPSFGASWWVGDSVIGRGNTGWTHQRVDIPAHARTAHKGLLQKRLEEDICWIIPHVPSTTHSVKGLNWTELTLDKTCLRRLILLLKLNGVFCQFSLWRWYTLTAGLHRSRNQKLNKTKKRRQGMIRWVPQIRHSRKKATTTTLQMVDKNQSLQYCCL